MPSTEESSDAPTSASDLRALLKADHERLDKLFQELVVAFRADDREEIGQLWKVFDEGLQAHLGFEDEYLLPELAKVHPAEAAAISSEHLEIRSSLEELGMGVELHRTNTHAVERFVRILREHARREEELMYHWAATRLGGAAEPSMRSKWLTAVRKFVGPGYVF